MPAIGGSARLVSAAPLPSALSTLQGMRATAMLRALMALRHAS